MNEIFSIFCRKNDYQMTFSLSEKRASAEKNNPTISHLYTPNIWHRVEA